jgi:hypothetical protein
MSQPNGPTTSVNGLHTPDLAQEPTTPSPFDSSVFRDYLLSLLPPLLGAAHDELEATLFDDEFHDRVTKFATEAGAVLYVLKRKEDTPGTWLAPRLATAHIPSDDENISYSYHVVSHLTYSPAFVSTLALLKRTPVLSSSSPIAPQLHLLNLSADADSPYEGLHAVVSSAMKPWFEAFVGSRSGNKELDGKMGERRKYEFLIVSN